MFISVLVCLFDFLYMCCFFFFFFSSRRRHTRSKRDWSSDVCSSDLSGQVGPSSAEAFAFFGLPLVADIVEEAMQIHVHRAPRLDGARDQGTIEAFMKTYQDDPFRSVSERYLALSDEIRSARIRHIRAHPELFVHPTGGTA